MHQRHTSSIIEIRRPTSGIRKGSRQKVYDALAELVESGRLVFPIQVYAELKRSAGNSSGDDLPFEFAARTRETATKHSPPLTILPRVLGIPGVEQVLDEDHPVRDGVEPADLADREFKLRFR
jgi:hypothetical protein